MAVKKGFLRFYSVCMFFCVCIYLCVCLSVAILQTSLFNIGGWNFNKICQNGIFYFFQFFLSYSSFFIFHYFMYFKAASKPIMKSNTPKWSLGLVNYFLYNDIDFASLWRHHMTSYILKMSPMLQICHFECLLDQ